MAEISTVYANGGVVTRPGGHENNENFVALIHRPDYNDWSFPKGKQEADEEPIDGAIREILEETGYKCKPHIELVASRYRDNKDRAKVVRYWLFEITEGYFQANNEVDAIAWLPFQLARPTLTYENDRLVLDSAQQYLMQE